MTFPNNIYFCIHVEADLNPTQLEDLKNNLDSTINTFSKWDFNACDGMNSDQVDFCVIQSAPVEYQKEYFEFLCNYENDDEFEAFTSNFSIKNKLNPDFLEQVQIPKSSPYRLIGHDYLGPVVTVNKRFKTKFKESRLSRISIYETLVAGKSKAFVNKEFTYIQVGPESYVGNEVRVQSLKYLNLIPEKVKITQVTPNSLQIDHSQYAPDTISVVIPTAGGIQKGQKTACVVEAVKSTLNQNLGNSKLEIIIVYDQNNSTNYLEDLKTLENQNSITYIPFAGEFNFSKKVNLGASVSSGDALIFLNDDTKWISKSGLLQIAGLAMQPNVGAVGAKLLFQSGNIQHGGIVVLKGIAKHAYFNTSLQVGLMGDLTVTHEVTAVTGACLAQKKSVWETVHGWDESLPNSYNDLDYCLQIRKHGLSILQANNVVLYHFESVTRDAYVADYEFEIVRSKWNEELQTDEFMPYAAKLEMIKVSSNSGIYGRLSQFISLTKHYGIKSSLRRSRRFLTKRILNIGKN